MKMFRLNWPVTLMISVLAFVVFIGCNKDDSSIPMITTTVVSGITPTKATTGGNITSDGGSAVTARGVCWSTGANPTIADNKSTSGAGTDAFTIKLSGLTSATAYNVRAYATNDKGTGYGTSEPMTTLNASVIIGTQEWMVENLEVTSYRNGDPIPHVTDATQWANLSTGAYIDYENLTSTGDTYGHLYNWYAVTDSRNICPVGWHVPSLAELDTLIVFLGGVAVAGGKLKSTGTDWLSPNVNATNESHFFGLPAGYRHDDGTFGDLYKACLLWSSTEAPTTEAYSKYLLNEDATVYEARFATKAGIPVRCIKD